MIRDIAPFGLRIPLDLKEQIRRSASDNGRSINSEILARLEASFDPRVDLKAVSTGELVRELVDRNAPGRIRIEISGNNN
jgi:Arc-like DNA binding domain.